MNKTRIIPRTAAAGQTPRWQQQLARAIRDPAELLERLALPKSLLPAARAADRRFPLRVPRDYLRRMAKGDANDPLLAQVLPLAEECIEQEGFVTDPVDDRAAMVLPGVLHKYHGRVLLTLTGACAIHCRYCFRRHFPYGDANPGENQWQAAIDYITRREEIDEVILSGGDPLTLSDHRLQALCRRLAAIPHLKRLRWHTRVPVVLPARLTAGLLAIWQSMPQEQIIVFHFNHPNELDEQVLRHFAPLRETRYTLLNQSVLLRRVNDDVESLSRLCKKLLQAGILPYYLHLLDQVQGAAHFAVEKPRAIALYRRLQIRLPGYLVPRLVQDQPGEISKTLINY